MKKIVHFLILLFFISTCLFLQAQDKPAFSSMDVFELEWASNPQISPDGQQVVYLRRGMDIMTDKRIARLWLINSDGTEHQKLTSNDANEGNPTWSPDGTRIAFTASTEQGTELFVYWLKTGKVARLSQLEASPRGLAWSPDGKWLAFTMFKKGKELSLVASPKKPKGAKWADAPRVTTRFKHEADGAGKLPPGYTHLFVIPAEGGSARQISKGDFNHGRKAHWTPDSKALLFSSNLKENWAYDFRNSEIYRLDIASGDIPTALVAEYGSGKPVIGILGEFDALPGLSQKTVPEKSPLNHGAPRHGCGHNLFGVASLGVAVAIKEFDDIVKTTIQYLSTSESVATIRCR